MENVQTGKQLIIKETKKDNKNNRVIYFDILNVLACICVVFLHMNGIVHGYSEARAWKTALVFETICYWAVPIFVMLSGATLLEYRKRYDTKIFFKKRFMKVLIPWIIWSLITFIINNKNIDIIKFVKDFIYCRIEGIYWFFPLILYLYCIIPILSVFTQRKEYRKILKAIFIFIFVFEGILNTICVIFNKNFPTIFNYCLEQNGYIMFLILGYLLSTTELTKKKRIIIYILGVLSVLIRYIYTYCFSTKEGILNRDLFNYCSIISVLLATAVFVFIKNVNWDKFLSKVHINSKVIANISSCSFGVYLIHMIVKREFTDLLNLDVYSIGYRTIGAVGIYIICLIIVYIIKKIPILKKIVP